MRARGVGVGFASIVGSFFVYGAHVACGTAPRVVPTAPAQTAAPAPSTTTASVIAPAPAGTCGCEPPKTTAWMVVSGDEKIAFDPVDAHASLDVAYDRGPGGKRRLVVSGVLRAYRADVATEHPTTFAVRLAVPEPVAASASAPVQVSTSAPKDVEAYLSTWAAPGAVAPRVYATVAKAALTVSLAADVVELRGALTLKDVSSGHAITIDKLSLRKAGVALLPDRTGTLRAP